jgi:immunoglobulin-binding protein 1
MLLQQALNLLVEFLTRLDLYDLISQVNKQLLDQYHENPSDFQLSPVSDAAERRRIKVARFQKEKGLKNKLEVVEGCVFGCSDSD